MIVKNGVLMMNMINSFLAHGMLLYGSLLLGWSWYELSSGIGTLLRHSCQSMPTRLSKWIVFSGIFCFTVIHVMLTVVLNIWLVTAAGHSPRSALHLLTIVLIVGIWIYKFKSGRGFRELLQG